MRNLFIEIRPTNETLYANSGEYKKLWPLVQKHLDGLAGRRLILFFYPLFRGTIQECVRAALWDHCKKDW